MVRPQGADGERACRCDINMIYDTMFINCKLGFNSVAVVSKLVQKQKQDNYIYEEKQYTKQYKNTNTQNRKENIQNKGKNIKGITKR